MRVFDRIDAATLDQREWHLWVMTIAIILILTVGMALLMYPTVFSEPVVLSGITLRKTFFGFCALSVLLVGYLVDRQIVIGKLRKKLAEDNKRIVQIRYEASADLLGTLPGLDPFRDRMAMEHRRASKSKQALSLLIVKLNLSRKLQDTIEASTAFGDAAKVLVRKLRGEDSVYHFAPGIFGVLLPGVNVENAYRVVTRLADGLHDATGASGRFSFDIQVINYPEHAATAWEMEEAVRAAVPGSSAVQRYETVPALTTSQ